MDEENPQKPQTTKFSRDARNKRIVDKAREGLGYDEIAREEGLTERRVRQIVAEVLEGREALESALHARLQIERVCRAVQVAGDALKRGDVRAVASFLKAVEKLDRYHSLARRTSLWPQMNATGDGLLMKMLADRFKDEEDMETAEATAGPPVEAERSP
jgi:hypothetical protein